MITKKQKIFRICFYSLICLLYFIAYFIFCISNWCMKTFKVSIDAIIFTITNPIKGTNSSVITGAIKYCVPRLLIVLIILVLLCIIDYRINNHLVMQTKIKRLNLSINITQITRVVLALCCIVSLILSVVYVDHHYDLFNYVKLKNQSSNLYEQYYINPDDAEIVLSNENGKKKNLIHIYLESMETTYASTEAGGYQTTNYMPYLTQLANENISFSHTNKLGGFRNTTGTTWTIGSILSQTAGVPFSFPVDGNSMDTYKNFAPGLTNLGDILEDFGYNQMFLCGSDGDFAGRKTYFKQHGNYEVLDYYQAIKKNYIDKDYKVWWGFEDEILYKIAQNELLNNLTKKDQPFNLTMLTVDTHHFEGYTCKLCGSSYSEKTANVVSCADKQIYNFVQWCKYQDFYEDTVIIITGDHPRMDSCLVENTNGNNRRIYNCFINCDIANNLNTQYRTFTSMDIFPTTLSALGFSWNGNRLGLGTDMFSNEKTLAEELGYSYFNTELAKRSNYYLKNFS